MFPRRDPNLLSQYLCRFCGERTCVGRDPAGAAGRSGQAGL